MRCSSLRKRTGDISLRQAADMVGDRTRNLSAATTCPKNTRLSKRECSAGKGNLNESRHHFNKPLCHRVLTIPESLTRFIFKGWRSMLPSAVSPHQQALPVSESPLAGHHPYSSSGYAGCSQAIAERKKYRFNGCNQSVVSQRRTTLTFSQ